MGENLNQANKCFKNLWDNVKNKMKATGKMKKHIKMLCYMFFLNGFKEGSGMSQLIR